MSIREKAEAATIAKPLAYLTVYDEHGIKKAYCLVDVSAAALPVVRDMPLYAVNERPALLDESETLRKALEEAAKELREAEDKFWVMHCNHPGDDPRKDMLVRRHDEDKAFMAELSKRMGNAAERARSALSHNQR